MAETHTIRAVIFDVDDTLFPESQFVQSGYNAVASHLRQTLGRRDKFEDWLWRRFLAGESEGAFDALNSEFSLGLGGDDISALVDVYRFHKPTIRPFDGMAELVEKLASRFRLGIITDGPAQMQRNKFEALGLGEFFSATVFTGELPPGCGKPSPVPFETVRQALGVPHNVCAYIGDNLAKDFVAPNELGWLSVQYLRPGQVHSHKPAPSGGLPRRVVQTDAQLLAVMGF